VFAAITGISIASATVFSRVAVPEMKRHGYTRKFATGVVAGSSVLGMLIPPSLLMIVYAVLAEESVGRMFLAGVGPGILLAVAFSVTILLLARFRRDFVFQRPEQVRLMRMMSGLGASRKFAADPVIDAGGARRPVWRLSQPDRSRRCRCAWRAGHRFAATVAGSEVILERLLLETGQITVSVLFLIMAATFFSRMLALSGVPNALAEVLLEGSIGPYGFLLIYLLLIIALGCLIDSISIMLILLPIALPIAEAAGFDLVWFGVLTVVAVEVGLLTPPFGLSVYIIKSAMDDPDLKVGEIFRGTLPFVGAMLVSIVLIIVFPQIATWLARF
jgi:C4-dicarboxylate transporter DctM subunit